ncbi:UNVERIFIED_CONTAM: hypothetical protein Sradi_0314300 [Sesamum radiatum]|uniref:Uncharacterized protein n=1 Tax=Sesamum radiatum TaxID=300843 RepID=A0AAW2W4D4_SESRA
MNVEHAIIENDDEKGALTVEANQNDAIIVEVNEGAIVEVNENVIKQHFDIEAGVVVENATVGTMILRPVNPSCVLMRGNIWMKGDGALKILQNLKNFGVIIQGIKDKVEDVIKRNRLALSTAILYQKCVLIFERISQLHLKPLDERLQPIATRTRRRKKGKNPLEPPDAFSDFPWFFSWIWTLWALQLKGNGAETGLLKVYESWASWAEQVGRTHDGCVCCFMDWAAGPRTGPHASGLGACCCRLVDWINWATFGPVSLMLFWMGLWAAQQMGLRGSSSC